MTKKEDTLCGLKKQNQMTSLLGTYLKTIQSFEQGWRNIPIHVEHQILFLPKIRSFQEAATLKRF